MATIVQAGERISYDTTNDIQYSICVTFLHAIFFKQLLSEALPGLEDSIAPCTVSDVRRYKFVFLCGGSGAELLGFHLLLKQILGSERRTDASSQEQSTTEFHIHIVDVHQWSSIPKIVYSMLQQEGLCRFTLQVHQLDLLEAAAWNQLSELLDHCDLVSLVYGLTELFEYNPGKTKGLLRVLFDSMPAQCCFLIADPMKTNRGKSFWIEQLLSQHSETSSSLPSQFVIRSHDWKLVLSETAVQASSLFQKISQYSLKLQHDVKCSLHCWVQLISRSEVKGQKRKRLEPSTHHGSQMVKAKTGSLICMLFMTEAKLTFSHRWLQTFVTPTAQAVHIIRLPDFTGAQDEASQQSALYHLDKELSIAASNHSVALFSFPQLLLLQKLGWSSSVLAETTDLVIIDDFDFYVHSKRYKWHNIAQLFVNTLTFLILIFIRKCFVENIFWRHQAESGVLPVHLRDTSPGQSDFGVLQPF